MTDDRTSPTRPTFAEVTFSDLDGAARSTAELAGRVVLLDFWATWCEPCREALPLYDSWQRELGERGLVVVAVNVAEEPARARSVAVELAPHVMLWRDATDAAAKLVALDTLPTSVLLGRDGEILQIVRGFEDSEVSALREAIERALGRVFKVEAP